MDRWPTLLYSFRCSNEMYVAERLIDAVARIDYPKDRLEIQVLDDSTDATRDIVARRVAELSASGFDIVHLHRTDRVGYKAGALAAGMARAHGEFVCVFDADFLPPADMLRRTLPHSTPPTSAWFRRAGDISTAITRC